MSDALPKHYETFAPFRAVFATGLPVLMYHKLGRLLPLECNKGLFVAPRLFVRQLAQWKRAGLTSAMPDETDARGKIAIPLDDGCASAREHASEPLREHGFAAIQFLAAGFLGKTNTWDASREPLMDRAQVRGWLFAGHAIGAHSMTHPRLTQIATAQAREEIVSCKHRLEDEFNVRVDHFCYPFGDWDERIAAMIAEAGCRAAVSADFGINTRTTNPFALKRIASYFPLRNPHNLRPAFRP